MKKIVFLTNSIPYPGNSGGTKITKKLLDSLLDQEKEIALFFLSFNDTDRNLYLNFSNEYSNKLYFYCANCRHNKRSLLNLLKSYICLKPLNVYRNSSKELSKKIKEYLQNNNDLIICDHVEMLQFVPKSYLPKTIVRTHNAEFKIWERYSKIHPNFMMRLAIGLEAFR